MAAGCDEAGNRTLGVLTKPDLIDKGAEGPVLNILQGTTHSLNLGWCIVRNPGQMVLFENWFVQWRESRNNMHHYNACSILYPHWRFCQSVAFATASRHLAYHAVSHILEDNPTQLTHLHLPPICSLSPKGAHSGGQSHSVETSTPSTNRRHLPMRQSIWHAARTVM